MARMCPKKQLLQGCVAAPGEQPGCASPKRAPARGGWCWGSLQLGWGRRTQKGSPSCSCEEAELLVLGAGCKKQQALLTGLCLASGATGDARGKLRAAQAGTAKAAATVQGQEHPWVPHCSFPGLLQCKGLSPCPGTLKGVTATGMGVKSLNPGLAAGYGGGGGIGGSIGVGTGTGQGTGERDSSWAVRGDNALPVS